VPKTVRNDFNQLVISSVQMIEQFLVGS